MFIIHNLLGGGSTILYNKIKCIVLKIIQKYFIDPIKDKRLISRSKFCIMLISNYKNNLNDYISKYSTFRQVPFISRKKISLTNYTETLYFLIPRFISNTHNLSQIENSTQARKIG